MWRRVGLRSLWWAGLWLVLIITVAMCMVVIVGLFDEHEHLSGKFEEVKRCAQSQDNGCGLLLELIECSREIAWSYFPTVRGGELWRNGEKIPYTSPFDLLSPEDYIDVVDSLLSERYLVGDLIGYGLEWEEFFLAKSGQILDMLKEVNRKPCLYPYVGDGSGWRTPSVDKYFFVVVLVHLCLRLERGDYSQVMEWLDELQRLQERLWMVEGSYPPYSVGFFSKLVRMLSVYPGLPSDFLESLVCRANELKEYLKSVQFQDMLDLMLAYYELEFNSLFERGVRVAESQGGKGQLNMSKGLDHALDTGSGLMSLGIVRWRWRRYEDVFRSASWEEIEVGLIRDAGPVGKYSRRLSKSVRRRVLFKSAFLDMRERLCTWLYNRNRGLGSIYACILTLGIERYYREYGVLPSDIREVMSLYVSEDEIRWISDYMEIYLSYQGYEIYFFPLSRRTVSFLDAEKLQSWKARQHLQPFRVRLRVG